MLHLRHTLFFLLFAGSFAAAGQTTFYPGDNGDSSGDTLWRFTIGKYIMGSPLLENSFIYVGGEPGKLYCLNAETGKMKWGFRTEFPGMNGIIHSVVSNGNSIFFNTDGTHFYCLDAGNGKMKWDFPAARFDDDMPTNIILSGNNVIFSGIDSSVYSVDQASGALVWKYKAPARTSPVNGNDNNIYFNTQDSVLIALDTKTGAQSWKLQLDMKPNMLKLHVCDNLITFVGFGGGLECIDTQTKKVKWKNNLPRSRMLAYGSGNYFFVLTDDGIKTFDITTGKQIWDYPGQHAWLMEPTIYKDKFYMYARKESKLFVLDLKTGKELKTKPFTGKTYTKVLVNDKMIFLGISDRYFAIKNE